MCVCFYRFIICLYNVYIISIYRNTYFCTKELAVSWAGRRKAQDRTKTVPSPCSRGRGERRTEDPGAGAGEISLQLHPCEASSETRLPRAVPGRRAGHSGPRRSCMCRRPGRARAEAAGTGLQRWPGRGDGRQQAERWGGPARPHPSPLADRPAPGSASPGRAVRAGRCQAGGGGAWRGPGRGGEFIPLEGNSFPGRDLTAAGQCARGAPWPGRGGGARAARAAAGGVWCPRPARRGRRGGGAPRGSLH